MIVAEVAGKTVRLSAVRMMIVAEVAGKTGLEMRIVQRSEIVVAGKSVLATRTGHSAVATGIRISGKGTHRFGVCKRKVRIYREPNRLKPGGALGSFFFVLIV